ncbi:MAG: amino acid-binding protein [Deltaproteobacteria bacterium]|nr:amino acid-binding protein [Deltaproteobacteria bacterium]
MIEDSDYMIPQLSVFIENRLASLSELARRLADENINLRGFTLAESREFGTVRIIVAEVEACKVALNKAGYHYVETPVLAVEVTDRPGGMANVLEHLACSHINVDYAYAMTEKHGLSAVIILRVDDLKKAVMVLKKTNVRLLSRKDITLI